MAFKIWDQLVGYSPLAYEDSTKRLYYGTEGLWSADGNGTFLDKWGNICTQHAMDAGHWVVANNGVDYLKVEWGSRRLYGAIGGILQETWLYHNESGTTGTVTLSDYAENYAYFDIVAKTNDGEYISTRISSPNGRNIILTGVNGGSTFYVKNASVYVSGNTISFNKNWEMAATTGTTSCYSGNFVLITTVIGYK